MSIIFLKRITALGLTNFFRNWWLSLAATLMMILTLVTMSVFVMLNQSVTIITEAIKDKIDMVVYFSDSTPEETIKNLQANLAARPNVKQVLYVSKEQALENFLQRSASKTVKEVISAQNNPLPRSLEIKATESSVYDGLAYELSNPAFQPYVRKISYQENREVVNNLFKIIQFAKELSLGLSVIFVVISMLVIINTLRLTIVTRLEQIEIMRLVGATASFVRLPYIVEAALYALFGTIGATLLVAIGARLLIPFISRFLEAASLTFTHLFLRNVWMLIVVQLLVGLSLAIIASFISIRRHLRV